MTNNDALLSVTIIFISPISIKIVWQQKKDYTTLKRKRINLLHFLF